MKFTGKVRHQYRIDLTSLIDVVFMLLLFFVLTTTFEKHTGVDIKYPSSPISNLTFKKDVIYLKVDRVGAFSINGIKVKTNDPRQLATTLKIIYEKSGDSAQLLIQADARTSHQSVVNALAAAQIAAIQHIGVVTISSTPTTPTILR